jgi:O-antigen/teichoic acid export membrane protein
LVVSFLLSWFLIPLYGIEGAGLSTLISYIFVFAAYMGSSQLYYPVPHSWFSILVSCLLSCVTVATVLWLGFLGWERWFFNVISLAFLLAAFVGLGLIKMEELVSAKIMFIKYFRKRAVGR